MEYNQKKRQVFSLKQKHHIGTVGLRKKKEYLANKKKPQKYWNQKRNMWCEVQLPGFLAATAREVFLNLKNVPHDDKLLKSACKVVGRSIVLVESRALTEENSLKKHYRMPGGGSNPKIPELRDAMFAYFVNVRTASKGRLPKHIFLAKAKELYSKYY